MIADVLAAAHAGALGLLRGLDGDAWAAPTPCDGWAVDDVVRHLVTGERAFAVALGGTAYDLPALDAEARALPRSALVEAYADAAAAVRAAHAAVPEGTTVPSPLGPVPADVVAEIRALEAVAHGWDVATATGLPLDVGDDAGLLTLLPAADRIRAGLEVTRPGNAAYGTASGDDPAAGALDRVLARVGRQRSSL